MRQLPHLKRNHRSGNWVYFRRYPVGIQNVIGKVFFERSLRCVDKKAVTDAWIIANQEFETQVVQAGQKVRLEAGCCTPGQERKNFRWISDRTLPPLALKDYGAETLAPVEMDIVETARSAVDRWGENELFRRAQLLTNDLAYREETEKFSAECRLVGACGHLKNWSIFCPPLMSLTIDLAHEEKLPVPPLHGFLYTVQRLIERKLKEILEAEARWREFDFSDFPTVAPKAAKPMLPRNDFLALDAVIEQYITATRKPRKTASKLRLVARHLESLAGGRLLIDDVSKALLISLQTEALKLPARPSQRERRMAFNDMAACQAKDDKRPRLSPQAVRSWFNLLSACFNWAISADLILRNPTVGVKPKIRKTEERARLPFDGTDLTAIFDRKFYPAPEPNRSSAFWLPLLGLFTGARLNEIGQLSRADIYIGDIPFIKITDETDDPTIKKRLKNFSSRREVPIHKGLIRLGFLGFVETVHGKYLFDDLPHPATEDEYEATKAYSQAFGRYLTRIGIKTRAKTFDSFRHTFIDCARHAAVNPQIISQVVGHESDPQLGRNFGSPTTAAYGLGHRLEMRAAEINKIPFPEDLPQWVMNRRF